MEVERPGRSMMSQLRVVKSRSLRADSFDRINELTWSKLNPVKSLLGISLSGGTVGLMPSFSDKGGRVVLVIRVQDEGISGPMNSKSWRWRNALLSSCEVVRWSSEREGKWTGHAGGGFTFSVMLAAVRNTAHLLIIAGIRR